VSLLSKQASSENGSFYVLQTPNSGEPFYHIGGLFLDESSIKGRAGFFSTYDRSNEQSLGSVEAVLDVEALSAYLKKGASSAELIVSCNFDGKKAYEKIFTDIQEEMALGSLKKAVLFSSSVVQGVSFPTKKDFFAYALKLLQKNKNGYLFGFYNPHLKHAYLGVSPEFLCREQDGVKYTTAVAGTKTNEESELEWSDKLLQEHKLVQNGIERAYEVEWSGVDSHSYGNLRHLKSEGVLKTSETVAEISSKLHPTSAVGALPQDQSYEHKFGDLSLKERSHFGGYASLFKQAESFSLVTIRGIEWSNDKSTVCIGGGVLPESNLEEEWLELENKWKTFKSLW